MSKVNIVNLEEELQSSYIDYAMSVIISRAIPDVRDGLKPVQRRILYGMYNINNLHNQPTKKSAKIVGEVMGKFHPHGDAAIYDTMVRMAQDFAMNHLLVEGQGNFGCFTKDTKIKLTDGRDLDFGQLIEEQSKGKRHWTFTFNTDTKTVEVSEVKKPRLTRQNAELVEVTLDNDQKIKCTPDHRFLLHSGAYRQARDLKTGESLMPAYLKSYVGDNKKLQNYETILQPIQQDWQFVHHPADAWNLKEGAYTKSRGRVRHHVDFNKKNNNPDNILRMSWEEHWQTHYELTSWRHKNDPEYVRKLAEGRKIYFEKNHQLVSARISQRNKENWKKPSYRAYHSALVKTLWKNEEYRSFMKQASSGTPRLVNALKYFDGFDQMLNEARTYNHKVKSVVFLSERADVYDITIGPWDNFALSAGVFVHNSVDGDPPAAMRYTEVRLTKIAEELLNDLDKETVNFVPNFDNTEKEPELLPSAFPNLLVNGAAGIAVGVATSMPPHNLGEICDAVAQILDNRDTTVDDLLKIIKGPDFPTGGIAIMSGNALNGYKFGKGQLHIKAKTTIDEKKNRIIVSEMPYNVNKATFVETVAHLARDKKIIGIRDIRDESDRHGISVVIELKEGVSPQQILNQLFKHTQLEVTFPINSLAVLGKTLRSMNVLQLLTAFISHRRDVVTRRSAYELKVAKDRLHLVEGLLIAISHIDAIIKTIKESGEVAEARAGPDVWVRPDREAGERDTRHEAQQDNPAGERLP